MKISPKKSLYFGALLVACSGAAVAVYAQAGNMLSTLPKGMWQLRAIGGGPSKAAQSQICVGDPLRLVQIQHGAANCTHRVLKEQSDRVTISYSCTGQGQGVTTIRRETAKLIQIESQGIRNGAPFNFVIEGRLGASC